MYVYVWCACVCVCGVFMCVQCVFMVCVHPQGMGLQETELHYTHPPTHVPTDSSLTLDLEYSPGSHNWDIAPSPVDEVCRKLQAAKV